MRFSSNCLSLTLLLFAYNICAQDTVQSKKDTLYSKYDSNYILQSKSNKNVFYLS